MGLYNVIYYAISWALFNPLEEILWTSMFQFRCNTESSCLDELDSLAEQLSLQKGCVFCVPRSAWGWVLMKICELCRLCSHRWCAFSGPRHSKFLFTPEDLPNLKQVCFPYLTLPAEVRHCLRMYKVMCNGLRPVSVSDGPSCCWMVVGWLVQAVSRQL